MSGRGAVAVSSLGNVIVLLLPPQYGFEFLDRSRAGVLCRAISLLLPFKTSKPDPAVFHPRPPLGLGGGRRCGVIVDVVHVHVACAHCGFIVILRGSHLCDSLLFRSVLRSCASYCAVQFSAPRFVVLLFRSLLFFDMSLLPGQYVCIEFPLRQGELSSAVCALLLFVLAALRSFAAVCSCRTLFVFGSCDGTVGA